MDTKEPQPDQTLQLEKPKQITIDEIVAFVKGDERIQGDVEKQLEEKYPTLLLRIKALGTKVVPHSPEAEKALRDGVIAGFYKLTQEGLDRGEAVAQEAANANNFMDRFFQKRAYIMLGQGTSEQITEAANFDVQIPEYAETMREAAKQVYPETQEPFMHGARFIKVFVLSNAQAPEYTAR